MSTIKLNLVAIIRTPEGAETTISHVVTLPDGASHHLGIMAECVNLTSKVVGEDIGHHYGFEKVECDGYWPSEEMAYDVNLISPEISGTLMQSLQFQQLSATPPDHMEESNPHCPPRTDVH